MRKVLLIAVAVLLLVPAAAFARPYEGADDEFDAGAAISSSMVVDEGEGAEAQTAEDLGRFDDGVGGAVELDRRDIL